MIHSILIYPRLPLKTPAIYPLTDEEKVNFIKENKAGLQVLIDDMKETVAAIPAGVGLASNQIGAQDYAVAVLDPSKNPEKYKGDRSVFYAIFPEILESSEPQKVSEGCLSIPNFYETLERFNKVKVKYFTLDSEVPVIEEAEGFLAQIWQHEVDHLNGKCFVDHLSSMKRDMAMKKVTKVRKRIEDFQWTPKKNRYFGS